jgi:hypothetical protein
MLFRIGAVNSSAAQSPDCARLPLSEAHDWLHTNDCGRVNIITSLLFINIVVLEVVEEEEE